MLNSRQRMEMTLNRAVAKQSKQNVVTPPRSDPQTGEIHERQRKERERARNVSWREARGEKTERETLR